RNGWLYETDKKGQSIIEMSGKFERELSNSRTIVTGVVLKKAKMTNLFFFFFKEKTAYRVLKGLVGSEMFKVKSLSLVTSIMSRNTIPPPFFLLIIFLKQGLPFITS
ncbi:hypothetical protein QT224_23170, partial [Escherichia coli]|uniref:hypothetical protein n=1 Tax=Escherichia coli TaxID=562 RepID=UPI00259CB05F